MTQRKMIKGQTMIQKALHRKLKIEQHEPHQTHVTASLVAPVVVQQQWQMWYRSWYQISIVLTSKTHFTIFVWILCLMYCFNIKIVAKILFCLGEGVFILRIFLSFLYYVFCFVCSRSVSCSEYCLCLWIVHSWLLFRFSLTFIPFIMYKLQT